MDRSFHHCLIIWWLLGMGIKAIGWVGEGSVFQKTCQDYFVELIALASMLVREYQNSTRFRRYDQFNFWGLDFFIGNRLVIFCDFFTTFDHKILYFDVESTNIDTRCRPWIESQKFWKCWSKLGSFRQKCHLSKIMFCIFEIFTPTN